MKTIGRLSLKTKFKKEVSSMKTIGRLSLIGVLLITLALGACISALAITDDEACTGILSLGAAAADGKCRQGQNKDASPGGYALVFPISLRVNKETGIKVFWVGQNPGLNSAGVSMTGLARGVVPGAIAYGVCYADKNEAYLVELAYIIEAIADKTIATRNGDDWRTRGIVALEYARTAKEAVDYLIEGLPKEAVSIIGPLKNQGFGHANAMMGPNLQYLQPEFKSGSYNRQIRAQELLDQRSGSITTPYHFSIHRDYDSWDLTYSSGGANIAGIGFQSLSRIGGVAEISNTHPDLLSIFWVTPNFPCLSPFLPFFIGIPEIPAMFAAVPTEEFTAFGMPPAEGNRIAEFHELFNAVSYNMSYMPKVQEFWEAFERQTFREIYQLEKEAKQLVKDGNREEAEQLLYRYSNAKCELALTYAKELTKKVVEGVLIEVDVTVPDGSWK